MNSTGTVPHAYCTSCSGIANECDKSRALTAVENGFKNFALGEIVSFEVDNKRLLDFSESHLGMEIYLLFSSLELFAGHVEDRGNLLNLASKNLFLEGVIVHSRCLYEFLYFGRYKNPKKSEDALAIHYFDSPEVWEMLRPKVPDHLLEFYSRASKEVVHLSYARLDRTEVTKRWDFYSLSNDLFKSLQLFVEKADPQKLHSSVKNDLAFWKPRVARLLEESRKASQIIAGG